MNTPKGFCFAVLLALAVFSFQNIDGVRRCTRKNYSCPNTTLSYDVSNPVVVRTQQRLLIIAALTSSLVPATISPAARDFINRILEHVNTDSPSELSVYFGFTVWLIPFLAQAAGYPSLCILARSINASVSWANERESDESVNSTRQIGRSINILCLMTETASLTQLGCENVPNLPNLPSRCHKGGLVYLVKENLNLNGKNLPCCIYQGVLDLYSSSNYIDNLLAAAMSESLTMETQSTLGQNNLNLILETNYLLLNNNVSVCCCPKRQRRFDVLCAANNASGNQIIEDLINNVFLYDECATESN